ncbi:MAG: ABC transporter ATP-binding protein [Deltaproteobacteria bacterium]|nr:ABC transporter ATP-binding protein [Deltaproteobacteria bacterium]
MSCKNQLHTLDQTSDTGEISVNKNIINSSRSQSQNRIIAELAGVYKRYGNTVALDGIDLKVPGGKLLAILGPNGAGKTTAISLLLGLKKPDAGKVTLLGKSPMLLEARRQVGVMMQEVTLAPEQRSRELIDLTASYYPNPLAVEEVMELTNTTPFAKRPYGKMSGGQKRQVQFAMALVGRPRLLFLDEPTAGMDIQAREMMWSIMRQLVRGGISIVLTTHYLEEAEALADYVVVLAKGRIVARGSVDEVRTRVARKQISCLTKKGVDEIGDWPGVQGVRKENQRLYITVIDAEGVVRRLLEEDKDLQELEVSRAGLAEAFMEITQEITQ